MKRAIPALVLGAMLLASTTVSATEHQRNFRTHLAGSEEVPAVETRAQGQAIFQLDKTGTELHFKLIASNIENIDQAHIHIGPPDVNGPVVAWLFPSGPPPDLIPGRHNGVLSQGTLTGADLVGPLDGATLDDLLQHMADGDAYVNVHTSQFPAGEIRGQIR